MEKLNVMADFGGVGVIPVIKFNSYSYPSIFFDKFIFCLDIRDSKCILCYVKFYWKKKILSRFGWNEFCKYLLMALVLAGNELNNNLICGYWVAFYLVMTG